MLIQLAGYVNSQCLDFFEHLLPFTAAEQADHAAAGLKDRTGRPASQDGPPLVIHFMPTDFALQPQLPRIDRTVPDPDCQAPQDLLMFPFDPAVIRRIVWGRDEWDDPMLIERMADLMMFEVAPAIHLQEQRRPVPEEQILQAQGHLPSVGLRIVPHGRVVRNITTHLATSNIAFTEGSVNEAVVGGSVDIGLAGELTHRGKPIGLVLDVGGWYKNVITLAPSLEMSEEEIDRAVFLLDQLLVRAKTK